MAEAGWWDSRPDERFWLELTDRNDIGADLKAPDTDESGRDNWRYSLFKRARVGDIVVHYSKATQPAGIVGVSTIAGVAEPITIVWAARGTYARSKSIAPHERPGYRIPYMDAP